MSKGRDHAIDSHRRHIHKAMRRTPRPTVDARRIQSWKARGFSMVSPLVIPTAPVGVGEVGAARDKQEHHVKERKGFFRRIFNRKTGG